MTEQFTIAMEVTGELPGDLPHRCDAVADAMSEAIVQITWKVHLPPCDVFQAVINEMIRRMIDNGHEGCAGKLVDRLAVNMAKLQHASGPKFAS